MQPISVLLADDNLTFLHMLTRFLQGLYHSEVVASLAQPGHSQRRMA